MNVYSLRQAQVEDLSMILSLFCETIETVCSADYNGDQLHAWKEGARDRARWSDRIQHQYFILGFHERDLVGFSSLAPDGYLDLLYVHKDWQGKGVASLLLTDLLSHAEIHDMMKIVSDVSITAAPFFLRKGFSMLHPCVRLRNGVEIQNFKMELILAT